MKHQYFLFLLLIGLLIFTGCDTVNGATVETIRGSGQIVTVDRDVGDFSSIQINLAANLVLTQSDHVGLTIEADENLMQHIRTEIQNDRLVISTPSGISLTPSRVIELNVSFTTLRDIQILGSSDITAEGLDLDSLAIHFSGSGSTHLTGKIDEQNITIRGQARISNFDLASQRTTIDISGNGTIEVSAQDSLNITVAGMGIVRYIGHPVITENISGTANISPQS
jgi:hypothetical protein